MGKLIHGHALKSGFSAEYRAYWAMRNRCLNPNQARFKDYGARGITICNRWLIGVDSRSGFECFLADVGPKPSAAHSLERRDNNKGYDPENTRWATRIQQARNTRANHFVDVWGDLIPLALAIEKVAIVAADTVRMRLHRGWSVDDALFVPRGGKPGSADREPVI
ncbi:MAG: hypothetical protein P4M09_07725 [Devosia sp.]|nr:hypothetical protein [Devosia sp.]